MKKKNLLNESQIRRMMKFANLEPLSENFFDRMTEEDGIEDEMPEDEMEPPMDDMASAEGEPMDDMGGMDDMDAMGGEEAPGADMEDEIRSLMSTIADAVKQEYDVDVNVDGEMAGDMEEPMGDMEEPMGDMEEPMGDMDAEPPAPEMGDEEEPMLEIFGDDMDSIDEEDSLEEGFNEATPSNPGKGMTPQGNNKTKASPFKGFTEQNGEEPGKGGHKLSAAPKPSLNKNKNSYGPTGDQETDKKPPMATNEVKQLKESIAAVVRRMLKERRASK